MKENGCTPVQLKIDLQLVHLLQGKRENIPEGYSDQLLPAVEMENTQSKTLVQERLLNLSEKLIQIQNLFVRYDQVLA
ncbi:MAG: hypothetical protein VXW44_11850 [SAR324 cluster bacterium]|nr:hypothetical protein [SAR324 cluster bacterium]